MIEAIFSFLLLRCLILVSMKPQIFGYGNCNSFANYSYVIGETPVTGLSNQIVSVYSYVPFALMLDAHLIVQSTYSRQNFEIPMRAYHKGINGKVELPFQDFFDFDHFSSFWKAKRLTIQTFEATVHCLPSPNSSKYYNVERKRWRSSTEDQLLKSLHDANFTLPTPAGIVWTIKSNSKMLGLYDFKNSGKLGLLSDVHASIRPSKSVRSIVQNVLQILPKNFAVAHIRAEGDVIFLSKNMEFQNGKKTKRKSLKRDSLHPYTLNDTGLYFHDSRLVVNMSAYQYLSESDAEFLTHIPDIIAAIVTSPCLRNIWSNSEQKKGDRSISAEADTAVQLQGRTTPRNCVFHSPPPIFLASGLFRAKESSFVRQRGEVIKKILRTLGFNQIFTRFDTIESVQLQSLKASSSPRSSPDEVHMPSRKEDELDETNEWRQLHYAGGVCGESISNMKRGLHDSNMKRRLHDSNDVHVTNTNMGQRSNSTSGGLYDKYSDIVPVSIPPAEYASCPCGGESWANKSPCRCPRYKGEINLHIDHTSISSPEPTPLTALAPSPANSDVASSSQPLSELTIVKQTGREELKKSEMKEQEVETYIRRLREKVHPNLGDGKASLSHSAGGRLLHTELAAYVDLEVARRSSCFVAAHMPSSFSYLAQRLRELDQGTLITEIGKPNTQFKNFFF